MSSFSCLTDYIPMMETDEAGIWIFDDKGDGTPENPKQFPFVHYTDVVYDFLHSFYEFMEEHPEYELKQYKQILDENGIKDIRGVDENQLDDKMVLVLIMAAVRGERFCEGLLLGIIKDGIMVRWLKRLGELDEGE